MGRDKKTPIEAHIRVNLSILNSPAYLALGWSARALYMDLRSKLRSNNNGNISAALTELKHRGWNSPTTLAKALRELVIVGLVAKTRSTVGVVHGSTVCNLYRFTDLPVNRRPDLGIDSQRATHDYKKHTGLKATQALVASVGSAPRKKSSVQILKSSATVSVVTPSLGAESGIMGTTESVAAATGQRSDFLNQNRHLEAVPLH